MSAVAPVVGTTQMSVECSSVKLKFHWNSFFVASSWHARRHARHPREDAARLSGVSGDFLVQVATRLPDWSAGGLLQRNAARLSACRVVLQIPRARHARIVADKSLATSILVQHVRHARFPRDTLATFSQGCREDATRKLLPWNSSLYGRCAAPRVCSLFLITMLPSDAYIHVWVSASCMLDSYMA